MPVAVPEFQLLLTQLSADLGVKIHRPRWAWLQPNPMPALQGSATRAVFDGSRNTVIHNATLEGARWARHASANACAFCRLMATRGAVYRSQASAGQITGRSINLEHSDRRAIAAGQMTVDEALERRSVYRSYRQARKQGKMVGQRRIGALRGTQDYGGKYHDHCHCIAVCVRPGDTYQPPPYVEQWEDDYITAARAAAAEGDTKGEFGAIDPKAVVSRKEAIERDRRNGIIHPRIEMVDITVIGDKGQTVTKRVPADSPAARAYAQRTADQAPKAPPVKSGTGKGPGGPGGPGGRTGSATGAGDDGVPPRVRGMLGPNTADEFPEFNRWTPQVNRSDIQEFGTTDAELLLAEPVIPGGHGGHAAGGTASDTFPSRWGAQDVRDWVAAIIDTPSAGHRGLGRIGSEKTSGFSLYGVYAEVEGVIRVRGDRGFWYITTAHPFDAVRWERELDRLE